MERDELPYKKRAKHKALPRASHKHIYKDCILIDTKEHPYLAEYCEICGRVQRVQFGLADRLNNGCYRMLSPEEIHQRHTDLPVFQIENIFSKHLHINLLE